MQAAQDQTLETATPERRLGQRHTAVILVAKLSTNSNQSVCRVRNISEMGAKLETRIALEIGQQVDLELRSDLKMSGRIVWVNGGHAGVQFNTAIDVERFLTRPESRIDRIRARAPRYKCAAKALVLSDLGNFACSMSDIALFGACLTNLPNPAMMRDGQVIKLMVEGIPAHHATVAWINGTSAGIKFRHPLRYNDLDEWLCDNAQFSGWIPLSIAPNDAKVPISKH
ncbi:MAG: PilZ domain-containing protein [Sphingorhabdus sp.]